MSESGANGVALSFDRVRKVYGSGDDVVEAVHDVTLNVEAGTSVAIIGPSGCGKSTLLAMAAGLMVPTSGTVLVDGSPQGRPRPQTALVQQDLGLLPWKTVRKNAELGLRLHGVGRAERRERADHALQLVGLVGFERRYPSELSGGMRQRLAFARALALDADLLLMDEPLSALDALSREDLQVLLSRLHRERGYTSVLVTHSIEEAVFLGDRVVVMTPRPAQVAGVIDNPCAQSAEPSTRTTPRYVETCQSVRALLEQAVGATTATAPSTSKAR